MSKLVLVSYCIIFGQLEEKLEARGQNKPISIHINITLDGPIDMESKFDQLKLVRDTPKVKHSSEDTKNLS